jgi:cytochrome bd-type quinol oxidase subunit 2
MRRIVRLLPLSFKGESMERKTSRNLYLVGIVLFIVATVLLIVASGAAVATANPDGTISTGTGTGLGILAIVSTLLFIVGGILATIAWVGALIKTARLGQWMWFVLLLIFSGITMLIYIFAGPTQPKAVAVPSM